MAPARLAPTTAAILAVVVALCAQTASAQSVNKRKTADPGTNASTARLLSSAALRAQEEDEDETLKKDKVIANRECGAVQVGGRTDDAQAGKPKSLVGTTGSANSKNTTLVTADIVNVCR